MLVVAPFYCISPLLSTCSPSFLVFDNKTCKIANEVDFDQETACTAHVCWSKYTTAR